MSSDALDRAVEGLDDLNATIERIDEKSSLMDAPLHLPQLSGKMGRHGVPVEVIARINSIVTAILEHLRTVGGPVYSSSAGKPPEWWRDLKGATIDQRSKNTFPTVTFPDAIETLHRHASDETEALLNLIFIVDRLEHKLMKDPIGVGFRRAGEPHSDRVRFTINPHIDRDAEQPLLEALDKTSAFPVECRAFLRRAINKIELR